MSRWGEMQVFNCLGIGKAFLAHVRKQSAFWKRPALCGPLLRGLACAQGFKIAVSSCKLVHLVWHRLQIGAGIVGFYTEKKQSAFWKRPALCGLLLRGSRLFRDAQGSKGRK